MTDLHRRSTDDVILEMHGMLCTLTTRLQDHMTLEEREHNDFKIKFKEMEARIEPLEESNKTMKPFLAAFITLCGSVLVGAGLSIWYWFKSRFAPHLPTQ